MTTKEKLLRAIENAPEPLLLEILQYLEHLTERLLEGSEDQEDLADLPSIREEAKRQGTIPLVQLKQELSR